ncbi:MAG: hypothetical protein ACYCWW_08535 [Deltaproteobacteria bacterium]
MRALPLSAVLLLASSLAAAREKAPPDEPLPPADEDSALRLTLGATGPLSEQYGMFDLGADYDLGGVRFLDDWMPDLGLHFGFVSHRVAMEPVVAGKRKWLLKLSSMTAVPYVLLGAAANLGFNRGSTDFGLAAHGGGGVSLFFSKRYGLTTELALDLGPLIAPGAALQAAFVWNIGVDILL